MFEAMGNLAGCYLYVFFFQAEDGIRDVAVTGVQTCALPISSIRSLLFPSFSRAFLRGLQTTTLATWGLSRSYNQAAQVPSSKVTDKVPRSPAKNSRMVEAFVSRMDSITTLPLVSITATEMVA